MKEMAPLEIGNIGPVLTLKSSSENEEISIKEDSSDANIKSPKLRAKSSSSIEVAFA